LENKKNNKLNTQKDIPKNNQYNEQLLNFYFEQALDGVFFMMLDEPIIWDDNTDKEKTLDYIFAHQRVTKINDAMLSQYRAKSEDFLNLTPNDFFLHDLEQGRKVWREFFDNGKLHIDTAEKRFDGTDMIIDGDYICIYDDKKRILGHFGVQREVTILRDAEQKLKSSEEKYRFIAENTSDGIVTFNKDFVITYCSPSYLNQLGYTDEEEIGRNNNDVKELLHPDDRESVFESIFNAIKNKHKDLHYSFRIKHKNGNYIWREDSAHFIYDENGDYNATNVTCRDVTLRTELENEFKQNEVKLELARNEAIKQSNYYRDLLENQSVYVVKIDMSGNYSYINKHFELKFGFDGIVGSPSLQSIIDEDRNLCIEAVTKCLQNPEVGVNVILRKRSTKTNEIITNYWEFKAIKNDKDELSEILCIGFDISDLYKAQIELKETINSLEEINNSLQNFAHIVSHNLRSHSANINGLLSLISTDYPDILINQYYDFLNKANDNLMETITHLSEVAQLHTNSKKDYYPVSLNKSLKNSIINIIGLAKNSGLKIINELYDNSIIIGEQSYIDSILLNFLTNAIKYRSNDKDSFVRISSYKENDKLVLVIEDNGLGIDLVRHRNKLFGMFKTFHEHPEARGIGLFITNNQVKALGGYIDVESQVGEGTTFKIYFMSGESI